jgi:hypothetical protein
MQVFDQDHGPFWEVFTSSNGKGMYAYLFDTEGGHQTFTIDANWQPNHKFTSKVVVSGGKLSFYYNGALICSPSGLKRSNLYFKTGDYC